MADLKTIGETCNVIRGKRVTKGNLIDNGLYPVISGGVTPMGFINSFNREANTITVSQYGTAGYVDYQDSRFWANDICYCIYPKANLVNKYLWYVLKNKQDLLYSIRNTDAVPYSLPIDSLKNVEIPIPSLSEQNRIVGILDTFTSAIDNLKEQIVQRRIQFEYYRDQLLDFEGKEGVDMKVLSEVCESNRGVRVVKNELLESGLFPVFQNSLAPMGYYHKCNYDKPTPFVITAGAAGEVGFCDTPFWAADDCLCLTCSKKVLPKYVFYYLAKNYFYLKTKVRKGAIPRLSKKVVESLFVPVIDIESQNKIIDNHNLMIYTIHNEF